MKRKAERKQEEVLKMKAYEKPRIIHQQSLEVVAGVCDAPGKATAPDPCDFTQS